MWSFKCKISELLGLKLMLRVWKNEDQSILRLFENINIKHNIMNSRKTNLRLIENITVQLPNKAPASKDILFYVSKFLEKIFQLMFEIIKWIRLLQISR